MPGMSTATDAALRPVGSAARTSAFNTACWFVPWTSTIGDWPVTVIVSATPPTRSSALTVAVNDPASSTPSRLTALNPGSANVTE